MLSQAGDRGQKQVIDEKEIQVKTDSPPSTALPFVHEQLPLPLQLRGHIPPMSQSLEPSAENGEEEVPPRRRATRGSHRALLQTSSHLLEKNQPKRFT